ncbi:MAG: hypothetical protein ROZ37_01400 [Aromatoleum sp.]|uniref:hypothetical protein n=1 Tax=Aromatoleum sp. TaxID=2307007 RepID=UPI0028958621|nr:hypothetical protein [Aromatoleum sp.]MDT3668969.1 hypothetical protein [Aromatoleum sp.]
MENFVWFSASELAKLGQEGVARLPTTPRGCRLRAESLHWETRKAHARGGPGGMRVEYCPDAETLAAIRLAKQPPSAEVTYAELHGGRDERRVADRRVAERRSLGSAGGAAAALPNRSDSAIAGQRVDEEVLRRIVERVEKWAEEKRKKLDPSAKAALVAYAFRLSRDRGYDEEDLNGLLELVAS